MAKKTNKITVIDPEASGTLIKQPIGDVMHSSMMPYSEYVILERALPRIEDGLKPVQRRILYTMWELKMDPDKPHRKSARVVGDTLGKYHPHGDTSVYDAMTRMAQDFNMGEVLVDGQGNFGSPDGDQPAAMRYTEVRMSTLATDMLKDIDKNTVQFKLNFDDTLKEPELLPAGFPNLLVNGASGIAVGFATEIPTHNLAETIDGCIYEIDNPECTSKDLMKIIPAPDFPTGGLIMKDLSDIDKVYTTGKGKVVIRAKTHIEDTTATKKAIVIDEFPYQVNRAKCLEKIAQLCEDKKSVLTSIVANRDESDKSGTRAVIEVKKDADTDKILAYLYKYSDLQYNFAANMVAVANGKPVRFTLKDCISYYINFRKEVITRRTRFELDKALAEKHIQEGLIKACSIIDEVIATIRGSKNPSDARENLMKNFGFSREQAQAILDLRLQRLTNLEILTLKAQFEELCKQIADLEKILASEKVLKSVIKKDLLEIKAKYGHARRSEIVSDKEEKTFSEDEFIVAEDVVVVITHNQEIKSIDATHFNRSNGDYKEMDVGSGDYVEYVMHTSTDAKILLFTADGMNYTISPTAIKQTKWKERGVPITNVLPTFERGEKIVGALATKDYSQGKLLFVTKNGMCKLTELTTFNTSRSKIVAHELADDDKLIKVDIANTNEVLFATQNGMSLRCETEQISTMGRASKGVRAIKLKENDCIVSVCNVEPKSKVVVVTDGAYGKIVPVTKIASQKRGGVGISIFKFNKNGSNGKTLIGAYALNALRGDEIILIKEDLSQIFKPINEISELPTTSAGKQLTDWNEGIVGCAILNESGTRENK